MWRKLGACASGSATLLTETLPWHVQYASFAGTLPNITAVRYNIIGFARRIREIIGLTCLFRSTTAEPMAWTDNRDASGVINRANPASQPKSNPGTSAAVHGGRNIRESHAQAAARSGARKSTKSKILAHKKATRICVLSSVEL